MRWRILTGISVVLMLGQAAACTTFGHKRGVASGADDDGVIKAAKGGPVGPAVVAQIGRPDPVMSRHPRAYWLQLRQSPQLLARARAALATGEPAAATQLARSYLATHPGDGDGLTLLAASLAMARKYDLAAYYASQAQKVRGDDATLLNIKGLGLMLGQGRSMRDYRAASALFAQAFAAEGQVAAGLNLGSLQLELGTAAAAQKTFASVVERCGRCVAGLMGLGVSALRSEQYAAAKDAFDEVLAKTPNYGPALYNLALAYRNGYNDNKQAEKYLFALIRKGDARDADLRGRAQTVLRMIKGEAPRDERQMVADDDERIPEAADDRQAELMMTGAADEAP